MTCAWISLSQGMAKEFKLTQRTPSAGPKAIQEGKLYAMEAVQLKMMSPEKRPKPRLQDGKPYVIGPTICLQGEPLLACQANMLY